MRVLILGSNGFIGSHLLAALSKTSWARPVAGVRRAGTPTQGVEQRIVDATVGASVTPALAGIDSVVNCVSGNAPSILEGARVLFGAAARLQPMPRIVHLSTMSVYGDASGLVLENAPLRGNVGAYSAAKVGAEEAAAAYSNKAILRPGCVYGPGSPQWSGRISQWLLARRLGDLGADGDGYCNLVHVDDVVTAVIRCLERGPFASPAFNLSLPQPPTWNEYFLRFAKALGAVPLARISHRRLMIETKLLAPPLKILDLAQRATKLRLLSVPPPIPPSLLGLMSQDIRLDVGRAEQELGLVWKPLEEGLAETAAWYL
jgi:nucleoside-diphosphate-sugar epimerase